MKNHRLGEYFGGSTPSAVIFFHQNLAHLMGHRLMPLAPFELGFVGILRMWAPLKVSHL